MGFHGGKREWVLGVGQWLPRSTVYLVLSAVILLVVAWACNRPTRNEIARVPSPDHVVDAVFVEVEPDMLGATVPDSFFVYIVPTGASQFDDPVLNGDHFEGLKLAWKRPKYLEIEFEKARIFHFTNFWWSKEVQDFHYEVEVSLRPTHERALPEPLWPKN
jgi:hypothetical protein